ncbi:MAG: macro domain-containing protein [Clostridia bacterium]|nr:macro domain-containing protein [Clostridia bacterium]
MPLKLIRQDITQIKCDAIVNPTNESLCPSGGTDAAIHRTAGPRLSEACRKLGGVEIGEAKITPAYALPCKYVIHTAGPVWQGGAQNEQALLEACYTHALELAAQKKCKSIAFPLISSGTYGYPKEQVLKVAMRVIGDFLLENEMLVYLVVYDKTAYALSEKLFADVTAYIDDAYIDMCRMMPKQRVSVPPRMNSALSRLDSSEEPEDVVFACEQAPDNGADLEEMLRSMDKGFAETLFDYIDAKGLTDVECYKRSNVDKKTFSKIKCNKNYKPSKVTAVSFAIGLRLNLEETNHLLNTVGMSLSHSSKFDVIIEYFIVSGNYKNIFDVNETLYHFDQVTLGV